jgi:hypothetical protein
MSAPKTAFLALLIALVALSAVHGVGSNPPAEGFDLEGSDAKAIEIADATMEAMGGREAWDATRYIRWKFFGRRAHVWDKHTGRIRIEGVGQEDEKPYVILMNIHSMEGRAWRDGQELSGDELAGMIDNGEAAWINDSYWIAMPYKLKDSGVTLEYVGPGTMQDERAAEVLQLTFEGVGRTPENRYLVYVATDSGLVEQWDFFAEAADAEPRFQVPWHNWQRYGEIMLSDNRGRGAHTEMAVFDELPDSVFEDPAPVDWSAIE